MGGCESGVLFGVPGVGRIFCDMRTELWDYQPYF